MPECLLDYPACFPETWLSIFLMEKPTDQDRVFIAGRTPGAIVARETGAIADPTLAGYVGKNCAQILAGIEVELEEKGRLPEAVLVLVRDLRAEHTRVADGSRDDGVLIARFFRVLGETLATVAAVKSSPSNPLAGALPDEEAGWESLSSQELAALCRDALTEAERIKAERKEISSARRDRLYCLRDAYNEALSREAEERGGGEEDEDDLDGGDPELYQRFKVALKEQPKKEPVGRPFYRGRNDLRQGETQLGGEHPFHGRP